MNWKVFIPALLVSFSSFCQSRNSDFLEADTVKRDTSAIKAFIRLSRKYQWIDSYRSINYAGQALMLAQDIHYKAGIEDSLDFSVYLH